MLTFDVSGWKDGISIGLFSVFSLFAGFPKLFALDFMVQTLADLGYGVWFTVFIGACWTAAGIGVWFKEWRRLAVIGTWFIISGAIAAHLTNGDMFPYPLLGGLFLGFIVLWFEDFYEYVYPR
jgi:hypothetical protein